MNSESVCSGLATTMRVVIQFRLGMVPRSASSLARRGRCDSEFDIPEARRNAVDEAINEGTTRAGLPVDSATNTAAKSRLL
jgi:hypothetical protein